MISIMSVFKNSFCGSLLTLHCCVYPLVSEESRAFQVGARHVEGKGVGYDEGYTTVEMFLTRQQNGWAPFVDVRGHVSNRARYAANAGIGLRYLQSPIKWGINSYYDYRTTRVFHYNQVGMGLEALGSFWSAQLNAYLPVGRTRSSRYDISYNNNLGPAQFGSFQGHHLLLHFPKGSAYSAKEEIAFRSLDASFSIRCLQKDHVSVDASLGPYYLSSSQGPHSALGGKIRLGLGLAKHLTFDVETTYDPLFRHRVQTGLRWSLPFGKQQPKTSSVSTPVFYAEKLSRGADRNSMIVVDQEKIREGVHIEEAIDPRTGRPYLFYYVNNQSHSFGTYESPFSTINAALSVSHPGDIIYVYPGSGAAYEGRFFLKDGQRLLSSSQQHVLDTQQGLVTLPAYTTQSPALSPTPEGPAVIVGHRNQISGFSFNPTPSGSTCAAEEKEGLIFTHNHTTQPLSLTNCYGSVVIENNTLGAGIVCEQTRSEPTDLFIVNNTFTSQDSTALSIACSAKAPLHLHILKNTSPEHLASFDLSATHSAQITGSIKNNVGSFIRGRFSGHSHSAIEVENNVLEGIEWIGSQSSLLQTDICGNTIHAQGNGIHLATTDRAFLKADVDANTIWGTQGIVCLHTDDSTPQLSLTRNTLSSPYSVIEGDVTGIEMDIKGRAHLDHVRVVGNNWISPQESPHGFNLAGIHLKLQEEAQATDVGISGNTLTLPITLYHPNTDPTALIISMNNKSSISGMSLANNKIHFPFDHYIPDVFSQGISILPSDNATIAHASLRGNTISFAPNKTTLECCGPTGIHLFPQDQASVGTSDKPLIIQDNTITISEGVGIASVSTSSRDTYVHVVENCIEFNPNGPSSVGILTVPQSTGQLFVDADTNRIEGNGSGWFGIYISNKSPTSQSSVIRNNSITHVLNTRPVDGGGIGTINFAEGSLQASLENNCLSGNTPNGIVATVHPSIGKKGEIRLILEGNRGYKDLAPDRYLIWNRSDDALPSVTYQDAGNNLGSFTTVDKEDRALYLDDLKKQ